MFLGAGANILRVFRKAKNDPIRGAAAPTITELPPSYAAEYPYNNVTATESGHLFEMDDTPGAERIQVYHRTGSHIELRPDGAVKYVSKSKRQDVTVADHEIIVNGDYKITVSGGANIYVRNGAFEIQADNGLAINVKGELKMRGDNIFMRADNKISLAAPKVDIGGVGANATTPFLSLPTGIVPIFGVLVPRVTGVFPSSPGSISTLAGLLSAVSTISSYARNVGKSLQFAKSLTDAKGMPLVPEVAPPEEIPVSNPQVYNGKSVERIEFRDRQFDTPEDVQNSEAYTAHQNLSEEIGDFTSATKALPGQQSTTYVDTEPPGEEPPPATSYPFASGGTVRFEQGNTVVVGTNTKFTEDVAVGMYLTFPSPPFVSAPFPQGFPRIASIANDTVMVITEPYGYPTVTSVVPYVFRYRAFAEYADKKVFTLTDQLGSSTLTLASLMQNYIPPIIEPEEFAIPVDAVVDNTTSGPGGSGGITGGEGGTVPGPPPQEWNDPPLI